MLFLLSGVAGGDNQLECNKDETKNTHTHETETSQPVVFCGSSGESKFTQTTQEISTKIMVFQSNLIFTPVFFLQLYL